MKTPNLNRFSPLLFRNGKAFLNRVVVPPMASETADIEGFVTEKTLSHYTKLASAKTGLVMVEYTFVDYSGRSEEFQLGLSEDTQIEGVKKIAEIIHKSKALAGIQLTHSGGKTTVEFSGGALQAPSNIPVPAKDFQFETPTPMSMNDIQTWKDSFLKATDRAVEAGFDLVELHAAHGYGLNQWLSPLTNKREDQYGGSIANNGRLLFEIIESIREKYPHLLLSVRMPGQDFIPGGLIHDEAIFIARELEKRGVDIINVSSGIGGWRRPNARNGEGYLVDEASIIQNAISIPVIGVGGIESGLYIDEVISKNKISLAAVGRAILKDPFSWGEENLKEGCYV
jgi:NADPH2 dehydrogenase